MLSDPSEFELQNQRGIALAKEGRLAEAEAVFLEAAKLWPESHKPHSNLALVYKSMGRPQKVAAALRAAVARDRDNARLSARLAQACLDASEREGAVDAALHAESLEPSRSHRLLAAHALLREARAEEALARAHAVLAEGDTGAAALAIEINCLLLLDREPEALIAIERTASALPSATAIQLAGAAVDLGRRAAATRLLGSIDRATLSAGDRNLVLLLNAEAMFGDGASAKAAEALSRIDPLPLSREGVLRLHAAWRALKDPGRAAAVAEAALTRDPDHLRLILTDAESALLADHPDAAKRRFEQALAIAPDDVSAAVGVAKVMAVSGDADAAIDAFARANRSGPLDAGVHADAIFWALHASRWSPDELLRQLIGVSDRFLVAARTQAQPTRSLDPDRRLKVGYVSADFFDHAVMRFLRGVLREHDRARFEIICYSANREPDDVTRAIQALDLRFVNITALTASQVALQIAADRVDILVDLAGHTAPLLAIFAHRPAPLQLTWLGFPASTGHSAIDTRVSDEHADPSGLTDAFHSERVVRLAEGAWCFEEFLAVPLPQPRLTGQLTFGSFNRAAKLSGELLRAWGRLLKKLPEARLLLKGRGLDSLSAHSRILAAMEAEGADTANVFISGLRETREEHILAWRDVDVCLDTFPYAGTTTTCEALFMGVPVVSLAGTSHVSRVGASLLSQVGLEDLVATDWDAYVARAEAIARDVERRNSLRLCLRSRMLASTLGSAKRFTPLFEAMLRDEWQAYACSAAAGAESELRRVARPGATPLYTPRSIRERACFVAIEQATERDAEADWFAARLVEGDVVAVVEPDSVGHVMRLAEAVRGRGEIRVHDADIDVDRSITTTARAAASNDVVIVNAAAHTSLDADLLDAPLACLADALDATSSPARPHLDNLLARVRVDAAAPSFARHLEALRRSGLAVFRALPGLGTVTAFEPEDELDGLARSLIVAGPRRIESLAQKEQLVIGRAAAVTDAPRLAFSLPCFHPFGLSGDAPLAVDRYAQAKLGTLSLAQRAALLEAAFEASSRSSDRIGGALTRARLAIETNRRSAVCPALEPLLAEPGRPTGPFLPALPSRDSETPGPEAQGDWLLCQALEAYVLFGARSSFDALNSHAALLVRYFRAGGSDPEMNRRLGLLLAMGRAS